VDSDNVLTFPEFVRVTGTYCMFGTLDILKFCFFVFDDDKRGYLDFGQVDALVRILNNHKPNANVKVAIKQLDLNQDGRIDFFEFKVSE
jgi:Ca2+-binding EF-hand superfamily protein